MHMNSGEAFVMIDLNVTGAQDTFIHVPDPTAVDPESGDDQFQCVTFFWLKENRFGTFYQIFLLLR